MDNPNYEESTATKDLKARQEEDYVPAAQLVKGTDFAKSDNGYVNVDPVYQSYADETHRPLRAEGGPEVELENEFVEAASDTSQGAMPESQLEANENKEEQEEKDQKVKEQSSQLQQTEQSGQPRQPEPTEQPKSASSKSRRQNS